MYTYTAYIYICFIFVYVYIHSFSFTRCVRCTVCVVPPSADSILSDVVTHKGRASNQRSSGGLAAALTAYACQSVRSFP